MKKFLDKNPDANEIEKSLMIKLPNVNKGILSMIKKATIET
jgi:hypothetical protein